MIRESQIVHESGPYWVLQESPRLFKVFRAGITHSEGLHAVPTLAQAKDIVQAYLNRDARRPS